MRYSVRRLEMLRSEYGHVARRIHQATLACVLCHAYDEYRQMETARICSMTDYTYEEAENMAYMYGGMFNMDVPVDAFLPADRSDDVLEHFRKYDACRKVMPQFGCEEKDLESFCKMVHYDAYSHGLGMFSTWVSFGWSYAMQGLYDYIVGDATKEQMQSVMCMYYPPDLRPMNDRQVRIFLRSMMRAVREFECLVAKRRGRRHE